ncbi:polyketide synthase [Trichoderma arundinaceum]|uniref:Polyketide synthase n=1 Tax=Trichoderma arundinaceum TaxID=490622 RepID=A0A395NKM0_TRIAR|nr:polyketide synthase [Trichoderma arundinaceum]
MAPALVSSGLMNGFLKDGSDELLDAVQSRNPSLRTQIPVAVVGMGCRLPGHSNSPTALWEFLQRGGVAKNEPPPSRFSLAGHYDGSQRPRTMKSPGGMFIEDMDPEVFDGQFFNISRADCIAMDPQQRQLLEVTYECLENAGIPLEAVSGTNTGVVVGANFIDYGAIQNRDPEDRAESITIGLASSILSNRISHFLNVFGPSMTVDTACSASLVAVDVACRYLDSFQADAMVVGGANLWFSPEHNEEVGMMNMTQSASGKCHSFDVKGDGYIKAEGINVVYLKRLDDAVRDGDPIRAIIRGTSARASGRTAGIANPSAEAQSSTIREAYRNAGIDDFRATSFLECHGTGTLAGDPVEVKGAASVFAAGRGVGKELIIGSIKSNIGHSEGAAGLSGLIKAVMAVESGIIPGNPTFLTPNPNIDWKKSRIRASRTPIRWPHQESVRRASINSFGFGGANAHAVIQNAPTSNHVSSYKPITIDFFDDEDEGEIENRPIATHEPSPKLLVFSANDQASLKRNVKALNAHLVNPIVSIDLNDLAYTLSERRTRHYYRAFSITRSIRGGISEETLVLGKQAPSPPRIGFVFTGQGAQWSQMGLDLIESFPQAKKVIEDLDEVLQTLPDPPSWTLLKELTEPRSTEALRQPEFSQPLVTALQLALVAVLDDWGIKAEAVVGHSSGEIAAAAAAGLIKSEDAIKIAYYRGQAAKLVGTPTEPVGMLAVGIGPELLRDYLKPTEGKIQIACYNSPSSLTMSGAVSALEKLCGRLKKDGHFARMLLVDLAYHSDYMADIGNVYEKLLVSNQSNSRPTTKDGDRMMAHMFSSVTGRIMSSAEVPDATYWKSNMVSPVKFTQATSKLIQDTQNGAVFLIEIGPSNALSGPIAQIKKSLPSNAAFDIRYASALKRGAEPLLSLYNTAGELFLSGGAVKLSKVNQSPPINSTTANPSVIIDLPNYSWNHSTRYWHETRASKDWRYKKFINHDLLGSKMIGASWQTPVFKKVLKLADVPWLRDHKLGTQVVFPGTAYIAMAVEAMYQTAMITQWRERAPARYRFRLRDVKFHRALVFEEDSEARITLTLNPVQGGSIRSWYEYRVCSVQDELSDDHAHSTGVVCVETDYQDAKPRRDAVEPLELATPGRVWYKALSDAGYNFGPSFQKNLMIEMAMGERNSRSLVNLEYPSISSRRQSRYPMHPAVMDACLQTGSPPLWKGDFSSITRVLVPKTIDSLVITGGKDLPSEGVTLSSAHFSGLGDKENPRNYATNVSLYDTQNGALLFEMRGLASAEIETSEDEGPGHTVATLSWEADIEMLLASGQHRIQSWFEADHGTRKTIQDVFDLIAHKKPGLKALELNMGLEDTSSLWIQDDLKVNPLRATCSKYHLAVRKPKTLIRAREHLSPHSSTTQFHLWDASRLEAVVSNIEFDLAIVKNVLDSANLTSRDEDMEMAIGSLDMSVRRGGFVIAIGFSEAILSRIGKIIPLPMLGENTFICQVQTKESDEKKGTKVRPRVVSISLLDTMAHQSRAITEALDTIARKGWDIEKSSNPFRDITSDHTVLVVDELFTSVMNGLNEAQWQVLKHLTQKRCRLLWVTSGGATDPIKAAIIGLLRTLRAEEHLELMTLDVVNPMGDDTTTAIAFCLEQLLNYAPASGKGQQPRDYEFVERRGIVHSSRLRPNAALTELQSDTVSTRNTKTLDLHECKTLVKLQCERLGNLDALRFAEATPEPSLLPDGYLEVEIYAAGLNYKDVVVTMGIVPGDETALGHEAAGVITKVTPGVIKSGFRFEIGQRVVVFGKGCFANRIQTVPERVHRIPDSMAFEEAATLSVAYLTSIHSLLNLANLSEGKSVLIHSAAGGVGIAAIQLSKYVGAEVFVTVGSEEKKQFLISNFSLGDDRIFNSRNTDFAGQILAATDGKGVDVVLNSLTGDMLDESFRILAHGGIMVEIGKKDILDRNKLSMAPFDRNISFRALDLSPERAPDALIAKLMSQLFELIESNRIKPISPIHQFSWADIPSAIRFLRTGKHMGKIVLSDGGPNAKIEVPVRRAPKTLRFQNDGCCLIVGGLRGLCGSLAIYLAKSGAKHLAVMSRSGYADEKSRGVIKQINALGAHIDLVTADVTILAEVEKAFAQTTRPVTGIIQGAMVLRDRPFDSMTIAEYHEAVHCKIEGTWNLHNTAENLGLKLDFFTMLSSISGVVGNRGQANYAAANAFLDSFAAFRRQRGQVACTVDLGVIEDFGFIANNTGFQAQHFDASIFKGINDGLLRKILYLSILQQQQFETLASISSEPTQIITGLVVPQPQDSFLKYDSRFSALFGNQGRAEVSQNISSSGGSNADLQALLLLLRAPSPDPAACLAATIDVINQCFVRLLRLPEPMDPARPFSVYGVDSLSAVEARNWIRAELGALVTTLDIVNASSLITFCEKIVAKLVAGT